WQQYDAVLKQMTLAKAVVPISGTGRPVRYKTRRSERVVIIGATEQFLVTSGLTVLEGRFMTASESDGGRPLAVLGYQVATNLFVGEAPIGKHLKPARKTVESIGGVSG